MEIMHLRFYIPMHILFQLMPIIGLCVTSVYAARCFRRRGSVPVNRCVYIFLFSMYMLFAYYLIIRPFAGFSLVAAMTTPTMQLRPFQSWTDFVGSSGFTFSDASTWLPSLSNRVLRGIVLNVLFFVPIGFFLRGVCGASMKKTLIIGFLICLFFELTQLTGLYFIYPRPYRIFDVDDFITNMLGALLGALITPLVMRLLPSPRLDAGRQVVRGSETPLPRRIAAMGIDYALLLLLAVLLADSCFGITDGDFLLWTFRDEGVLLLCYLVLALIWAVVQWLANGKSLGLWLCGLRLHSVHSPKPELWQYMLRSLLFALVWALPSLTFTIISTVHHNGFQLAPIALAFEGCILCAQVYLYLGLALGGATQSTRMIYDRLSGMRPTRG